jgi:hypothetical protein
MLRIFTFFGCIDRRAGYLIVTDVERSHGLTIATVAWFVISLLVSRKQVLKRCNFKTTCVRGSWQLFMDAGNSVEAILASRENRSPSPLAPGGSYVYRTVPLK